MTRKDFELIASILESSKPSPKNGPEQLEQWQWTCECFGARLSCSNANFDRARFLRACGL
jgi:hypothetical protein